LILNIFYPALVVIEVFNGVTMVDYPLNLAFQVVNLFEWCFGNKVADEVHDEVIVVLATILRDDLMDTVLYHVD